MGRFQKGQSGNPGGRRAMPKEVRLALKGELLNSVQALILLRDTAKDESVRERCAARLIELNLGKQPVPVFVSGPAGGVIESKAVTVHRVEQPNPAGLAAVLNVLSRVGRLPAAGGVGSTGAGPDAQADEVHPAPAAPDAGGVPSP